MHNYYDTVNDFLNLTLNELVLNHQIELCDLKKILLICYQQLIDPNPNVLTNSLLITNLKRIVDIENYCNAMALQNQPKNWDANDIDKYVTQIVHPRVIEMRKQLKGNT